MKRLILSLFILQLSLSSCGGVRYETQVNSFADPGYAGEKTYYISPGNKNVSPDDLEFKEYAALVSQSLAGKGFTRTDDPRAAALSITLAYGISDPVRTPYSYSSPVYGQTGGGTANVNMTTSGSGGSANTAGTVSTPETFGIVGYNHYSGVSTEYTRSMTIEAFDFAKIRQDGKMFPVWKTTAVSKGSYGNLRGIIPYMILALEDYIATSSTVTVKVDIKSKKKSISN